MGPPYECPGSPPVSPLVLLHGVFALVTRQGVGRDGPVGDGDVLAADEVLAGGAAVTRLERMPYGRWSGRFAEGGRGRQLLGEAVGQQGGGPVQPL